MSVNVISLSLSLSTLRDANFVFSNLLYYGSQICCYAGWRIFHMDTWWPLFLGAYITLPPSSWSRVYKVIHFFSQNSTSTFLRFPWIYIYIWMRMNVHNKYKNKHMISIQWMQKRSQNLQNSINHDRRSYMTKIVKKYHLKMHISFEIHSCLFKN